MRIKALILALTILLILPELTRAVCDASYETYRYKSAVFYVSNARKIGVTVYNSMNDRYPRCFTAWIKVGGSYVNLDGLPYSPENWQQAWASTAPNCYSSGYRVASDIGYAEYDLGQYSPYTGIVEVRVSSDCYEVAQVDPCFCWTAEVEVVESAQQVQYCYLDIYVKDQYGNPLNANIYVDGSYLTYASHAEKQVLTGTHTVFASRSGYSSDSRSVSCSCGERKRVDLVLSSAQVCTPGEIRNRYCACSTQVAYEKCRADGSGWYTVVENCPSGHYCSDGYCVYEERCEEKYLNEYRCSGSWVQRKYQYSDCSTSWVNWEYCSYGCSAGSCLPRYEEPCEIGVSVTTPNNAKVGDVVTTTIRISNSGDRGGYVSFDAYVCDINSHCYRMSCDGYSGDPTAYIPAHDTRTFTCSARVQEDGSHKIKVSYSGCGESENVYSRIFWADKKETKCVAKFLNEFKCSGNWKLQLYRYSDCSTAWVYVEYCSVGCSNGSCLPKPTTTTTTLPVCEEEKEIVPTGCFVLSDAAWVVLIILIVFLLALVILWLLDLMKFRRNRRKPEWFGRDC
ncbi:MAG: hypothetical protein QXU74_02415 [Candidatus Aenigmatarchaeota archaeon]